MKYLLPGGKCRYFRAQKVRFIKEKNRSKDTIKKISKLQIESICKYIPHKICTQNIERTLTIQ